jgi:hypothetical protein
MNQHGPRQGNDYVKVPSQHGAGDDTVYYMGPSEFGSIHILRMLIFTRPTEQHANCELCCVPKPAFLVAQQHTMEHQSRFLHTFRKIHNMSLQKNTRQQLVHVYSFLVLVYLF